jgi:hypothetical protein
MAYQELLYGLNVIFPQAIVPGMLGLRSFSPFARKQDFEELRREVSHEEQVDKGIRPDCWTSDRLRTDVRTSRGI